MVGTGNGIGSFGFTGGELFSLPLKIQERRNKMPKSKKNYAGPLSQKLLEGSPEIQAWFDKRDADFEASLTDEDSEYFRKEKAKEAFDNKYITRSEYEKDLKLAKSQGRTDATIFCILILSVIFIALFWLLRLVGVVSPGDFGIS